MISDTKILVVRFSSIGDIVLTSPVVRCLKAQTGAEIHYLTKSKFKQLLEYNPNINKIWTIDSSVSEVLDDLKKESFDYVIDLHNNIRSSRVKRKLNCKSFTLNKHNLDKWFLVNTGVDRLPDEHIVDRYMKTVEKLGVKNDNEGLDFYLPLDFYVDIKICSPFIIAAIGGQHEGKRFPSYKWAEVFSKSEHLFVLVGGKEDEPTGEDLAAEYPNVMNLCGQTSLMESAALIEKASLVITNDTGMMHIAAAYKKIIISLWGQTTPKFGMYPYLPDERSVIIEPEPKKRRLSKLGNRTTEPHVMDKIEAQRIVDVITTVLGEQKAP